jgi:hypothetical protein
MNGDKVKDMARIMQNREKRNNEIKELKYREEFCAEFGTLEDTISSKNKPPSFENLSNHTNVKWILMDKKNQLSMETREKIEKLGWTEVMRGVFESPRITSIEAHTTTTRDLLNVLPNTLNDGLDILASFGGFSL